MTKDIYLYNFFQGIVCFTGVVDDYDSFTFERSYSGIGEWQIVISGYSKNAERLLQAQYIRAGNGVAGLITKHSEVRNETEYTITVNGIELKGLAEKRIVIPSAGETHQSYTNTAPELIIKGLLEQQLTNTTDDARLIYGTVEIDDGIMTNGISYEGRFSNVAEDIIEICEAYQIGWYADIEDYSIVWHIYHGIDRKASQDINNRLIISYEYDSLDGGSFEQSFHTSNTALVAGQGEGVERATVIVNSNNQGINRTEIYIDARDIEDDAQLPQRGAEKLAEYGSSVVFDATPAQGFMTDNYRKAYDLGDIGTMKEAEIDFRLTSITEIYENNSFSLNFVFGYDAATLSSSLKRYVNNANTAALVESETSTQPITMEQVINKLYPIGALYVSTIATNPATILGVGTWEQWGAGRVPIGVGTGIDSNGTSQTFDADAVGGEYTHTLTIAEMPKHRHSFDSGGATVASGTKYNRPVNKSGYAYDDDDTYRTTYRGGNEAHNNLPPYQAVYMWRRTA